MAERAARGGEKVAHGGREKRVLGTLLRGLSNKPAILLLFFFSKNIVILCCNNNILNFIK